MSKRNTPVGKARGRKAAPIKKPFPLGFALGSAVLAAALIGILVYAVQNQSLGDKSSLTYAQHQIDGLVNSGPYSATHVDGAVNYPGEATAPPVGGNHNQVWQNCLVYTQPLANEHAVHALEHGATWVTYNPDKVTAADIATLKALVDGNPYRLMSPYPGLKSPISLQAWGEQLFVTKSSDPRIKRFLDLFTQGPQTREPGAACSGGTSATGPLAPTSSASPMPMPSPTHS